MHEGHHGILDDQKKHPPHGHKPGATPAKPQKEAGATMKIVAGVIVALLLVGFLVWKFM